MIYSIIGKNEVNLKQMHIYLKNKTGNDGGNLPELFDGIAETESVNSLYAFATACVLTNNFTEIPQHPFETTEVAILALVQYLKGMASSLPLKNKCVTPLYENLVTNKVIGTAPTLLNLDGDFFSKHCDKEKYSTKEAADSAEDSFPYWIINVVKEIKESNELIIPKKSVVYALPYYIQNISDQYIEIYDKPTKDGTVIGKIPPTGVEAVESISLGFAKLYTSKSAYIELNEKLFIPVKHVETLDEIKNDLGEFQIPDELPFTVIVKEKCLCNAGFGTTDHYFADNDHSYGEQDEIVISDIYLNYGVVDGNYYVPLNHLYVYRKNDNVKLGHEKNEKPEIDNVINQPSEPINQIDQVKKYMVIIPSQSNDKTNTMIDLIKRRTGYDSHIESDKKGVFAIVVDFSSDDLSEATMVRKKILATGYRANVVEKEDFYSNDK